VKGHPDNALHRNALAFLKNSPLRGTGPQSGFQLKDLLCTPLKKKGHFFFPQIPNEGGSMQISPSRIAGLIPDHGGCPQRYVGQFFSGDRLNLVHDFYLSYEELTEDLPS
jgi:hypothetical protein